MIHNREIRHRGRSTARVNGAKGNQSMPEALVCVEGKPDRAGGPVSNTH